MFPFSSFFSVTAAAAALRKRYPFHYEALFILIVDVLPIFFASTRLQLVLIILFFPLKLNNVHS